VIYQTRVSCRSVLIGSRKEESTKLSTNARCILIHRERWSGLPAELVLVALQVSIIFLVLMWRIDYAGSTVNNPIWTEPQQFSPFMPDEVSYISGRMVRFISLSDVLLNYLENPVNVNLWGDFIFFLSQRGFKWVQIVWINIVGYFVFVAVLLSLLDNLVRNSAYGFLIFAIITFNPGLFQISVSSIRDIWILVFLVASILSLRKKLYVLAVLFTILLGILRTYMLTIVIFFAFAMFFKKKFPFIIVCFLLIILSVSLLLQIRPYFLQLLRNEFLVRFVENFTGLNWYMITGRYKLEGSPTYKLEIVGNYYVFLSYSLIWTMAIIKRKLKQLIADRLVLASLISGLYLTVLHAMAIGFLVLRIKLITWLLVFAFISPEIILSDVPGLSVSRRLLNMTERKG